MKTKNLKLSVGCVPYLNAFPLVETLDFSIRRAPPSQLARELKKGSLEVALLPVFETFRESYKFVPGISISCFGKVKSVLLHFRAAPRNCRVCALDKNSLTSNALARVLLERRFGAKPRYVTFDPSSRNRAPLRGVDAAVTIGDNSFRTLRVPSPGKPFRGKLDMGEEWKRFTGLPFVFAVWVHRPDHPDPNTVHSVLQRAKREGLRLRKKIASREASRLRLPRKLCEEYLMKRIRYDLGPREKAGLRRFRALCREMNLI